MESYATAETAGTYFQKRLYCDAWTKAGETEKESALLMAAQAIDRQPLKGRKTSTDQSLAFPRYPDTTTPQEVMKACYEEALALLEYGNSKRIQLQREGVQSFSLGDLNEVYGPGAGRGLLSQQARELLRPWLAGAVRIT